MYINDPKVVEYESMQLVRIGVDGGFNCVVGDFKVSVAKAIDHALYMSGQSCSIGVFPELTFSGYLGEELYHYDGFLEGNWKGLERFAHETGRFVFRTLFFVGVPVEHKGAVYNCAAVVCAGRILAIIPKENVPNYNVFHERRIFSTGKAGFHDVIRRDGVEIPFGDYIVETPFGMVSADVCEDIWIPDGPMVRRCLAGALIHVNLSASPFRIGALETRRQMLATRSGDNEVVVAYANTLGAHDGLTFSGDAFVHQNGGCLLEGPRWARGIDGIGIQDFDLGKTKLRRRSNTTWRSRQEVFLSEKHDLVRVVPCPQAPGANQNCYRYPFPENRLFFVPSVSGDDLPREEFFDELEEALVWSLAYFDQASAFKRIGLALSGGRDSVLSLIIAWLYARRRFDFRRFAMTRDFIHCFSMPTRFNSDQTRSLARRVADELDVTFSEVSIQEEFEAKCRWALDMLPPDEREKGLSPLVIQNIQACIRADRMMVWSRSCGGMILNCGNMSEKATGYGTILGDWSVGAFGLLGNMPKTLIEAFMEYLGKKYSLSFMPELLGTKASAELENDQADEDQLMPFPILDALLYLIAGEKLSPADAYRVVRSMWSDEQLAEMTSCFEKDMLKIWTKRFVTLFFRSIYKWVVAPMSAHVGSLDLDRERAFHLPVAQSQQWLEDSLRFIDEIRD